MSSKLPTFINDTMLDNFINEIEEEKINIGNLQERVEELVFQDGFIDNAETLAKIQANRVELIKIKSQVLNKIIDRITKIDVQQMKNENSINGTRLGNEFLKQTRFIDVQDSSLNELTETKGENKMLEDELDMIVDDEIGMPLENVSNINEENIEEDEEENEHKKENDEREIEDIF